MGTSEDHAKELREISARLHSLNVEKSRIDAEIADTTEQLREMFENHFIDRGFFQRPRSGRARTNFADTATASEVACLLRITERSAHRLVQHAAVLVNHHPRTLDALRTGAISWSHATALVHEYAGLPAGTAVRLEEKLLPIAIGTTVPRMAYRARKLRADVHPEALEARCRAATLERRVEIEPTDDAMAWLHVLLEAADAAAIDARLTREARGLQAPAERRNVAQLRTDVLTDLLLDDGLHASVVGEPMSKSIARRQRAPEFGQPCQQAEIAPGAGSVGGPVGESAACPEGAPRYRSPVRAHINVTVPVLTLLGVDDAPADLEGYGPIPADIARRLAAHAPSFTRLLTHPETGAVLSVGRTSYSVPADLKRWLQVRDRTCRHPGCSVAASRCELDHTTPWSHEGPTSHDNLAHLCRKHHMLKTEGVWHYEQEGDGVLSAISPAGARYRSALEPRLG
ncbi:DUF222 domain-containing protein [Arthrobacter agilis]|uniref:HNH endonuclease signature motif containing protein n=1 Tax=Arthrobacter agilis TaxID=37921 RepID=UPI000B34F869|nr:HNH endonuclease signature motif containing protein [Arthrobacter agilis]OUM40455.1 hypothetical protein B8W74_13120 [Arthrobacter agilis]PPB45069.1 HNH endonuclease [Arthrobacter agilis]TPV27773.1 DUF222 domain-containing protein [Arthrobacter agilis]VDR31576.1 Domain of uncharacterised function DUF222 [Arthrobacter agilis]